MSLFLFQTAGGKFIRRRASRRFASIDLGLGRFGTDCAGAAQVPGATSAPRKLPRKEVIQPHLPVRLPCYDFTLLTEHTFGAFLPEGLERRLRVHPTRMV
jgi:hypothetical protein